MFSFLLIIGLVLSLNTVSAIDFTRISVSDEGEEGNDDSRFFGGSNDISPNGRYIVFTSSASNLVSGDTNEVHDIFLYDTTNQEIERVSLNPKGLEFRVPSFFPSVSADGRYVAFSTLVNEGEDTGSVMYLRDRRENETILISADEFGDPLTGLGSYHLSSINEDNTFVIFSSTLIDGPGHLIAYDIENEELMNGGHGPFYWINVANEEDVAKMVAGSFVPLVEEDLNDGTDIYVVVGSFDNPSEVTYELVSLNPDGEQFEDSMVLYPSISSDGNHVAFTVFDEGGTSIYLRDLERDQTIEIVSTREDLYYFPVVSGDGQFVVFSSIGAMVPSAPVYIWSSETGEVSTLDAGSENSLASISSNGQYILFSSEADDLVDGDTNEYIDAFLVQNPFYEQEENSHRTGRTSSGGSSPIVMASFQAEQLARALASGVDPTPYLNGPTSPEASQNNVLNILRTLKQSMTGDDVKALQTYLNTHGYDCGIADGVFGLKTKQAVIKFQIANGLIPDGVVGMKTQALMK